MQRSAPDLERRPDLEDLVIALPELAELLPAPQALAPVHIASVGHDGPFAHARCSCGWRGPGRRALSRVRDDLTGHHVV